MNFTFDTTISLGLIVTLVGAIIGWVRMQMKRIDTRIDICNERLDRHEARISLNEQALQVLPKKDELHQVNVILERVAGDMREMRALMSGQQQIMARLETVVSRQEDHLMSRPK